jgi:VIT1/CCC1 family predicted Fe2+/Mn2+ transporter
MAFTNTFHRIIRAGLAFGVALPIAVYALVSLALAALLARSGAAKDV